MKNIYHSSNHSKIPNLTKLLKKYDIEFSLLSYSEYIQFATIIPMLSIDVDWWLRSINYYSNEIFFVNNTSTDNLSHAKSNEIKGIRPIMIINDNVLLKPKDIYTYGNFNWTVLATSDKTIAICNYIIDKRVFNKNNYISDFLDTDIKHWLDNEFINVLFN